MDIEYLTYDCGNLKLSDFGLATIFKITKEERGLLKRHMWVAALLSP
jgi:hypothetical protein